MALTEVAREEQDDSRTSADVVTLRPWENYYAETTTFPEGVPSIDKRKTYLYGTKIRIS